MYSAHAPAQFPHLWCHQEGKVDKEHGEEHENQEDQGPALRGDEPLEQTHDLLPMEDNMQNEKTEKGKAKVKVKVSPIVAIPT